VRPSDLAYLSLRRRPVSSLLALFSLGLALGMGGWILNLYGSVFASIETREPGIDVILGPKSNGLSILLDSIHLAGGNPDVIDYYMIDTIEKEIAPRLVIPIAQFAEFRNIPVIGTDDSFRQRPDDCSPPLLAAGRWFNLHVEEVVAGARASLKTGLGVGDSFVARSVISTATGEPVWQRRMLVVGVLKPSGLPRDNAIFTHIPQAWSSHKAAIAAGRLRTVKGGRGVNAFLIGLDPTKPEQKEKIHDMFQVGSNAQVVDVEEEISGLRQLLGQGQRALAGLAALLVLLAVAVATLLFSERFETMKKELGVLRALGYTRLQVASAILWEGVFLSLLGISLGMVIERIGHLVTPLVWNPPWLLLPEWPSPTLCVLWATALLTSLLATVLPLWRLYRWDAHDSLKGM